jgi:signal transduction histidine kinase
MALAHADTAATLAARMLEEDGALRPGMRDQLGMAHIRVLSSAGLVEYQDGPDLPHEVAQVECTAAGLMDLGDGEHWAVACERMNGREVVAAWQPAYASTVQVVYLVMTLAAIVGIVTALGVLRLLTPLSRLSNAIARVGAGERGIRVPNTGLVELDRMVERFNTAARAMEDREDAILARIQAVQDMARVVAHEVRNPLQSLELLTSLVVSEPDEEERQELAKSIHTEIQALDMVVTRVLREGVPGSRLYLHRATQQIGPIFDQVIALRQPEARTKGIRLEREPPPPAELSIDGALLGRSIENLVLNALQAVPSQGGHVRVSLALEPDWAVIVVEDNGPGVDPTLANHVFEPNVTGRPGGTGLGLALVKEVVEAHGGYIGHDRSPLGGARFSARIPRRRVHGSEDPQGADRR